MIAKPFLASQKHSCGHDKKCGPFLQILLQAIAEFVAFEHVPFEKVSFDKLDYIENFFTLRQNIKNMNFNIKRTAYLVIKNI